MENTGKAAENEKITPKIKGDEKFDTFPITEFSNFTKAKVNHAFLYSFPKFHHESERILQAIETKMNLNPNMVKICHLQ